MSVHQSSGLILKFREQFLLFLTLKCINFFFLFRFCLFETSCVQEDNFPSSLCVKVNGKICQINTVCSVCSLFIFLSTRRSPYLLVFGSFLRKNVCKNPRFSVKRQNKPFCFSTQ